MKIVMITGSAHRHGTTAALADQFQQGALDAGHEVYRFDAAFQDVHPCIGCDKCLRTGECTFAADDMKLLNPHLLAADAVVFVSPVYYFTINAQLKAVIDRTVARWLEVKNKELYYIVTMADECISSADTTLACFRGYAECVEGAVEKGVIIGSGVCEAGTIRSTPAMAQAYEMGRKV